MNGAILFSALLLAMISTNEARRSQYNSSEAQRLVEEHNHLRTMETIPRPNNMRLMRWDPMLASLAQGWADQCVWKMGQPSWKNSIRTDYNNNNNNYGRGVHLGQNLYMGTTNWPGWDGPHAIRKWFAEKSYYDFCSNSCASNRICGHYTQARTAWVGCGFRRCDAGDLKGFDLIVCNYFPPGNVNRPRERPYMTDDGICY